MQTALEYYARSGHITEVGETADRLNLSHLPSTIPGLCRLIQGVFLHPFEAHRYGVNLFQQQKAATTTPPARAERKKSHVRSRILQRSSQNPLEPEPYHHGSRPYDTTCC